MMKVRFGIQILVLVSLILLVSGGSLVIPPDNSDPFVPICHSYSGLCHIAYNITEDRRGRGQIWHGSSQICRCPGSRRCPIQWQNRQNSIVKVFKMEGKEMEAKISYCQLNMPSEICQFNTPAVTLRGDGPFHFEVYGDFQCKCNRRLFAHRSWKWGDYNYIEYSCGKPRCILNHSDNTCMRMTYQPAENNTMTEYVCRCRWNEECTAHAQDLPTPDHPVKTQICHPVNQH